MHKWNTALVTTLESTFHAANQIDFDIRLWDISKTTTLSQTFKDANRFAGKGLDSWGSTASVTNLYRTFYKASSMNADLTSWDVSRVISLQDTFYWAKEMNGDMSGWHTTKVASMHDAFRDMPKFAGEMSCGVLQLVLSLHVCLVCTFPTLNNTTDALARAVDLSCRSAPRRNGSRRVGRYTR